MARFHSWCERRGYKAYQEWDFPSINTIKEFVEDEAKSTAKELFKEFFSDLPVQELKRRLEEGELIDDDVDTRIREEADVLLTWNLDNILVAYAYAGEYEPEKLTDVPKTIEEYAKAVAYEVWVSKITEKLEETVKEAVRGGE